LGGCWVRRLSSMFWKAGPMAGGWGCPINNRV
jgi:hypothetical protein